MDNNDKEVLLAILERLRSLERQQWDDARAILRLTHAFLAVRPEHQQLYDNFRGLAEQLAKERSGGRLPDGPDPVYDALIQRLKAGA